ncbi:rhodanese-related sulfurtransferase [Nakamurella sp. UYEF19]|uniref:rhodanese-like domain-containing protein n=1 Tax=Nakamurella sp. UYEF19 TaxID=1756392 RepID=UPI003399DB93
MRRHIGILAVLLLLVASGCSAGAPTPASVGSTALSTGVTRATTATDAMGTPMSAAATTGAPVSTLVDPARFAAAIAAPGTVTIDVHIPFEGRIAGTDDTIPYDEIAEQAAKLPADHNTELAIYCRTGSMSAIAAVTLASLGYHHVVELHGGMQAWETAGRTLLSTP